MINIVSRHIIYIMKTFKQFLLEASVGEGIKYTELTEDEVIEELRKHCSKSLKLGAQFWRGLTDKAPRNYSIADLSLTERRSENTTNFYTIILDNHPEMKKFPKRSKSLIFTSSASIAHGYGDVYAVFPYDTSMLGECPKSDMWSTQVSISDSVSTRIESLNYFWTAFFSAVGVRSAEVTFASFETADQKLKGDDPEYLGALKIFLDRLKSDFDYRFTELDYKKLESKLKKNFLDTVFEMYSLEYTNFQLVKPYTEADNNREYWCSGKVILIKQSLVDDILEKCNENI